MTASYVAGFCKAAGDCGIDPEYLCKRAFTPVEGGILSVFSSIIGAAGGGIARAAGGDRNASTIAGASVPGLMGLSLSGQAAKPTWTDAAKADAARIAEANKAGKALRGFGKVKGRAGALALLLGLPTLMAGAGALGGRTVGKKRAG